MARKTTQDTFLDRFAGPKATAKRETPRQAQARAYAKAGIDSAKARRRWA